MKKKGLSIALSAGLIIWALTACDSDKKDKEIKGE